MPMLFSPTPHVLWRLNSFGSFAMLTAIRLAPSLVSTWPLIARAEFTFTGLIAMEQGTLTRIKVRGGDWFNLPQTDGRIARHVEALFEKKQTPE